MEKIEFKPSFFTSKKIFIFFSLIFIDLLLFIIIIPRIYQYYTMNPDVHEIFQLMVAIILFMIILPFIFLLTHMLQVLNKKVWVEDHLIYFLNKSFVSGWFMDVHDLNTIESVNYHKKMVRILNVEIGRYYFLLHLQKNKKAEISLDGWNIGDIKHIETYLRKSYPHIKFNTHLYRNTPAAVSGVHEFIEKNRKPHPIAT